MAPPFNFFHAYIYATSSWYAIRGVARIWDPVMVFHWFEHNPKSSPSELEIYNIRTDALGLLALSLLVLTLSTNGGLSTSPLSPVFASGSKQGPRSNAITIDRAAIAITIAHHLSTAWYAYWQWQEPATTTGAMLLGWAYSGFLSMLGIAAWLEEGWTAESGGRDAAVAGKSKKG